MDKDKLKSAAKQALMKEQPIIAAMMAQPADAQNNAINLQIQLKKILADAFVFYFKAQTFHWNVEGSNFPQYHDFFGKVYDTVQGSVDPLAEHLRMLGAYAPNSLSELLVSTNIREASGRMDANAMFMELIADNNTILAGLNMGYDMAEELNEFALSNFLQGLIEAHKKLHWMLKSTARG